MTQHRSVTPRGGLTHNQALGRYGERKAEEYLRAEGMALLGRNVVGTAGEIDLLLRDGDALVACEVKTRSSLAFGSPHAAVDEAKLHRLRAVAEEWAQRHHLRPAEVRVDLVAIIRPRSGGISLEHIRGMC